MADENDSIVDRLKIGSMGLGQSLGVWGIVALAALALILAIVATFTGQNERGF